MEDTLILECQMNYISLTWIQVVKCNWSHATCCVIMHSTTGSVFNWFIIDWAF